MQVAELKKFETDKGVIFANPAAVVAVLENTDGAILHFADGNPVKVRDAARVVAQQLWGFLTSTGGGYINDNHINLIGPNDTGCTVFLTNEVRMDLAVTPEEFYGSLRRVAETRQGISDDV